MNQVKFFRSVLSGVVSIRNRVDLESLTTQIPDNSIGSEAIQVRLKDEAVIKYLSEGIYTSWKSAIRELFANELTAALTAKEIDPDANPRIEIRVNPETRELVIHGVDSLGITQDTFADKLIYYGRSGNTSSRKLGRFGFGMKCVSSDTECLTTDGWKKYSQIEVGSQIATYNMNSGVVEYKPLRAIHTYDYTGKIFKLGWSHGPIVTENHRNVVCRLHTYRQGGSGEQGSQTPRPLRNGKPYSPSDLFPRKRSRIEDVVETNKLSNTDKILLTASHDYPANDGVGSIELAALIGWTIAEGYYPKSIGNGKQNWRKVTRIGISQNEGEYADEIRGLMRRLGINWREERRKTNAGNTNILFVFRGPMATRIRQNAPNKMLNAFLASLPKKELEALFWALVKGESYTNGKGFVFVQKSKVTLDWFQIIALRLGYYCGTKYFASGNVSRAYVSKKKYRWLNRGHGRKKLVNPIEYSGIVWCPEVENGTWVARRDGWPFITGNSYVAIGKSIRIESHSRETNERFGVLGSEGAYFKRMSDTDLSVSDYGTKISVILKDDEEEEEETPYNGKTTVTKRRIIEFEELIKTIREVCRYSDIDTFLTITSDIKERKHPYYGWSSYESIVARAGREKISYSPKEYAESQLGISGKDSTKFEFELDEPDFCFFGILKSSNGNREVNVSPSNGEVRLIKMPIEVTVPEERQDRRGETREVEPEYPMSFWFVNLKDESVFPPTPDRERLKEGSFVRVHETILKFLKDKFAEMQINSFADYRNSKFKEVLDEARPSSPLRDFLTEGTCKVLDILDTDVIPATPSDESAEYRHHWRSRYSSGYKIKDLVSKSENLFILPRELTRQGKDFVLPKKRAQLIQRILRAKYQDAIVFLHPGVYQSYQFEEHLASIKLLQRLLTDRFHVKDAKTEAEKIKKELGKEWRKLADVEPRRKKDEGRGVTEIVVWKCDNSYGRIEPVRTKPSEVGKIPLLRVRANLKEWVNLLKKYSVREYAITKEIKSLDAGLSEEEFREYLAKRSEVSTASGRESIQKVASTQKKDPLIVLRFCDPEILKYYKPHHCSQVICVTTDEEAFRAVAYMKLANKKFIETDLVDRKVLRERLAKVCVNKAGTNGRNDRDECSSLSAITSSILSEGTGEDDYHWSSSHQEAINYMFIALSKMPESNASETGNPCKNRNKIVSLLWDALSNTYDTKKMKGLVQTAVSYA